MDPTAPTRIMVAAPHERATTLVGVLRGGGLEGCCECVGELGPEALARALRADRWDAVLVDYRTLGAEPPAALRALREAVGALPILVVSDAPGERLAIEALKAGADDYFLYSDLTGLPPALEEHLRRVEPSSTPSPPGWHPDPSDLRALLESLTDGLIVCDPDGRILYMNAVALRLYGLEGPSEARHVNDLLARCPLTDLEGHAVPSARSPLARALRGEAFHDYRLRVVGPNGESTWVGSHSGAPVCDAQGRILLARVLVHDVTELARAEREAREDWERLDEALRHTQDVMYRIELPHGRWVYASQAAERVMGYTRAEMEGMTIEESMALVHPEDRATLYARTSTLLDPSSGLDGDRVEYRWRTRSGEWRWLASSRTLLRDAAGRPVAMVGDIRDVTERKEAEESRSRQLQTLDRLVEVSRQVLAETTVDGLLTSVVDAARALTGARIGTAGHGHVDGSFRVGYASRSRDVPPCLPGGPFGTVRGGVYEDLIGDRPTVRLTDSELRCHPHWWGLPEGHVPLRGLLGARLVDRGGRPRGLVMVSDKAEGEFTAEDEAFLGQLAALTSLGLQHIEARQRVEEQRRLLETLIRTAPLGIAVVSAGDWRYELANPAYCAIVGVPCADLTGRAVADTVPELADEGALSLAAEASTVGDAVRLRGHRPARGHGRGDVYWDASCVPLREADGTVNRLLLLVRDVTAERAARHSLQRRIADLTVLCEASRMLLGETDEVRILQRACGLAVDRFGLAMAWAGLLPEGGTGPLAPTATAGQDDGYVRRLVFETGPEGGELPVTRAVRTGAPVAVDDIAAEPTFHPGWRPEALARGYRSLAALPFRGQGGVLGVLAVYAGETQAFTTERLRTLESLAALAAAGLERARLDAEVRRHAETLEEAVALRTQALRDSEARFRAIYEGASEGIAILDPEGRLLSVNPALEAIVGRRSEELLGRPFTDLAAPSVDRDGCLADLRALARGGGRSGPFAWRFIRGDGRVRWGQATLSFVQERGEPGFTVAMLQDVTEEREAHAALVHAERLNVTAQLAIAFGHEVKNPLQGILMSLSLLEENLHHPERVALYLRSAREALWRADRIITRLRELHPWTEGQERVPTDVYEILEEALLLVEKQRQMHGVRLELDLADDLPRVLVVRKELQQVFLNLILNALDAMPDGGTLRIVGQAIEEPAGLQIDFEDTGVGIPLEELPEIFGFLYSTKEGGSGLGLFVCQDVIRSYGGYITVQSEVGVGTTFRIWLPEA